MNAPHCPTEERWLCYVDRALAPEESTALAAHLSACATCRAQVEALAQLVASLRAPALPDFDAAAHAQAVLTRIAAQPDVPAAQSGGRFGRRAWLFGAAAACAAGALLIARGPASHFQARGGREPSSIARDVGLQLYETEPTLRPLAPGAAIRARAPLTAGYRNLGSDPAYLLLFAVDRAGEIHWIAPPYTEDTPDPAAAELAPSPDERLLPHTVQLDALAPGDLRVMTVITHTPVHVSSIEALEPTGVSAHSITAALPRAEVRELRLVVREGEP